MDHIIDSSSTSSRNYYDPILRMHHKAYSDTRIDMINLQVIVALGIEVLDTISMVLNPNNLQSYIPDWII